MLEQDEKRVKHVHSEFSNLIEEGHAEIFSAVDGSKDDIEKELESLNLKLTPDFAHYATIGQVGCALSHLKIWENIKKSGIKSCIIFEDDALLVEDYVTNLQHLEKELSQTWDFVNLFTHPQHSHVKNRKEIPGKMQLLNRIPTWGTVGYIISLSGVKKLLDIFAQTGIYAPIDVMIQDVLDGMISYNLKHDLVTTIGQLTESGKEKDLLHSNVWNTKSYKKYLQEQNKNRVYFSHEKAVISSKNLSESSLEVPYDAEYTPGRTTFNLKSRAPQKGDHLNFQLSLTIPSSFLEGVLLRFSVRSHYRGLEYAGRMAYSLCINQKEIFHEKVGFFNQENVVSLIIPHRPESGILELELGLKVLTDCEDWNWGPISKITVSDFSIEEMHDYQAYFLSTSSPYSVSKINEESSDLKKLIQQFASTGESVDVFIPGGNRGDGLIYQGAFKLFRKFGLKYNILPYRYNNVIEEFDDQPIDSKILLILGSGGFSSAYNLMVEIVPEIVKKYSSAFILPSSFDISCGPVKKFLEQLPEHVSVFCRERKSFEDLSSILPKHRLFLDHDTALEFDYSKWIKRGTGVLHAFRDDKESSEIQLPIGNQDISAGPDSQWKELLDIISQYSIVHTNRAHVSIAAAKMSKEVHIYPSSYFKQKEIFSFSLSNFQHVVFHKQDNTKSLEKKGSKFYLSGKTHNDATFTQVIKNSIEYLKTASDDPRKKVVALLDNKYEAKKFCKSFDLKFPKHIALFSNFDAIQKQDLPSNFVLKPIWGHTNKGVFLLENIEDSFYDILRKKEYSWKDLQKAFSDEHQVGSGSILIEELLYEANPNYVIPFDYKFHVFRGEVEVIMQRDVNQGPNTQDWQFKFYDRNWKEINNPLNESNINHELPIPKRAEEMLTIVKKLSLAIPIPFVRIDLYESPNGIYFGEFTFHPGNHWLWKDAWQKRFGKKYLEAYSNIKDYKKECTEIYSLFK